MIIHDAPQGTKRWLNLRAGIPTSSCFDKIMTAGSSDWKGGDKGKPKSSTSAEKYMQLLLAERIMGHAAETFQSDWMARGNEFEEKAVASYEFQHDCTTESIGFVTNDDGNIGCSPDRLIVGAIDGMLETKCPAPQTHVAYLLAAAGASTEYKVQLQGQLWICEREWVDILSYHPEMPEALFRVTRDEVFIKELSAHVLSFSRQLEERSADFMERGWIKQGSEMDNTDESFLTDSDVAWAKDYAEGKR